MRPAMIFNRLWRFYSTPQPKGNVCFPWIFILVILLIGMSQAQAQNTTGFSDAIGILAQEQSLAESYAAILKEFGRQDVETYARGIQLYANAKAEYDGLIEQMKHDLTMGKPLDNSSEFKLTLENAADQRIAFTDFVSNNIIGDDPDKRGAVALAIISTAGELIPALIKAGTGIWNEYRKSNNQQKQEILAQIDALKWKAFHEIGGGVQPDATSGRKIGDVMD